MDEVADSDTTACSSDENFSRVESQCQVTTLRDLQRRRQILLAKKMLLLNTKAQNNQNLPEVEVKTNFFRSDPKIAAAAAVSNPKTKLIPQVLPLAYPQSTSDEEIAQCDTFAINTSFQMKLSDLEFTNYEVVRSIENKENQEINNLPCMDIIDNQYINLSNFDLMELNIVSTEPIFLENLSLSNIQPSTSTISERECENDSDAHHGDLTANRKRKSTVNKDTSKWKKIVNRDLRMKGEKYLGYRRDKKENNKKSKIHHDVYRPARTMKQACNSTFCNKSKLRNCNGIDECKRQNLFDLFWKTMSWEQRRLFICSHVTAYDKKQVKNPDSNRSKSLAYFLTIDNARHQVCKKMFLNTLGIKEWFVRYWSKKTDCAMPPPSVVSRNIDRSKKNSDSHEHLQRFLDSLPKMPSHYCRANSSRQYLEPVFQTMSQLYREYVSKSELNALKCLSRRIFDNAFLKLNLSLFRPKKDQCDVCCGHKVGNISDAEMMIHRNRKNRAREEKDTDKKMAIEGKCHVFTQDVQSVKLAPCLQASAIYYKTKLCVHNFTMYNLATHEACCYWFDETHGSLEASVFASCIVDQLKSILNRKLLPVILFSDAQNRNYILSNALLRLSIDKNVMITQKYLEKGHTQMECDSVHSAIECKLKGKEIYLPSQYVNIANIARDNPMPYESRLLEFSFYTDFSKDLIYKSIRPGKKAGDPTVTDLRVLNYKPDGTIWYSLNFDEPLQPLPQRPMKITNIRPLEDLPNFFSERLPISQRKYKDLQDLKAVIPSDCHSYYDELPYKN